MQVQNTPLDSADNSLSSDVDDARNFVAQYLQESPQTMLDVIITGSANPAEASILASHNPVLAVYPAGKKSNEPKR